jgi:hypothetical protein
MHYCGLGLQAQHLRVATEGLRGIEMGSEFNDKSPTFSLEPLHRQASQHRVTICWIDTRLPAVRPAHIETGLLFGLVDRSLHSAEEARRRTAEAQEFWRNGVPDRAPQAGGSS